MSIRLADYDPGSTGKFKSKAEAETKLARDVERLQELQDVFAAARAHALLIILQGMDTSGKDGAIKHVMSGMNPQGVTVSSFKAPTEEEALHDFLWRYARRTPERGRIGIFNRSYYEEVLVVRVHHLADAPSWSERYEEINAFERHLTRNGTGILKFFLHLSKDEQRKRLLARLDDPSKHWKFSVNDISERQYWEQYQDAYDHVLHNTNTEWAPWHVIPADHKWYMRTEIADSVVEKLASLKLSYPKVDEKMQAALVSARERLDTE